MIYRDFKDGLKTSLLGMGCMRLTCLPGTQDEVDYELAEKVIDYAYQHGVNYFDTAYVYLNGNSERTIGKALSKYPRESYFIADKMPGMIKTKDDVERIFAEQLERCGVDYFDFYLCHNVNERSIDTFIDLEVPQFMERMRDEGKIRYLGFSSHGKPETLRRFATLRDWDFAQIQLNYFDWFEKDTKAQYEVLRELGIPIVVMEPVRGGRLASLTDRANDMLRAVEPERSISSWAFRFVQELPGIQVVLSGMNAMEQIEDNLATFSEYKPLRESDHQVLKDAIQALIEELTVPCTACRYCNVCPQELDIPTMLQIYNQYAMNRHPFALNPLRELPEGKRPADCLGCGACANACPQNIQIPDLLKQLAEGFEKLQAMH